MLTDRFSTATPNSADIDRAGREYRFFRRLALIALVLCCAIAVSLNLVDPDLWGHVLYGQELLTEGKVPETASHTFTAPEHRWINHENLAEIAFALGFKYLGVYGMLGLKCAWGMLILGLMVTVARRHNVDQLVAWGWMLLVANNLIAFFPMRPQLFSFMWFAILLVVLDRAFIGWGEGEVKSRWLWLAPAIMAMWTNSHGGFVAGLCVMEAYLGGRIIELFWRKGHRAWPLAGQFAAIGIVTALATLINPYGLELHSWLGRSLGQARPEITEWARPTLSDPIFAPFFLLVGMTIASLLGTRRRRDWTEIVILALVTWQAASHLRHIAFLAMLCGFWMPAHLQSACSRLRPSCANRLPVVRLNPWFACTAAVVLAAMIGCFGIGLIHRLTDFPVRRDKYPVDALQFMANHKLGGNLVVSFNWAQYAIAALRPNVRVAFDGRFRTCYPQEIVDMHFDFLLGANDGQRQRSLKSGPIDGLRVLEFEKPNLVLVDRTYQESVQVMHRSVMNRDPRWTILYQDGTAQIWGRRDIYDDPSSPHYLDPAKRILTNTRFISAEQWPALPKRAPGEKLADRSAEKWS